MDRQEVYDTVIAHLRRQGRRAMNGKYCAYRAPDNTKCAVGCLIPDELYDPSFEGASFLNREQLMKLFPENLHMMLHQLQEFHDNPGSWDFDGLLENRVQKLAIDLDVTYHPPEGTDT